jgi:DNA-binding phage protein
MHFLYKALSDDGNPSFATVGKVVHALGCRLAIERGRAAACAEAGAQVRQADP